MREFSAAFTGGCLGGLINRLLIWFFGIQGINARLGVAMRPALTAHWLYPAVVWGGLWGFLLLLPFMRGRTLSRGLLFSLAPSVAALFFILPIEKHAGALGLSLGLLTPVLVLFFNAVWGVVASYWYRGAS